MPRPKLKAYEVAVYWANQAGVIFADTPSQAKSAWKHSVEYEWNEIQCRRAPDFDDLADKEVTIKDYLDRDWGFECANCSQMTANYYTPPTIVVDGKWPCCCQKCADAIKADPLCNKGGVEND